jgi:hypothetical protein
VGKPRVEPMLKAPPNWVRFAAAGAKT